jgi:tRNA-Thr(GGU) m(6)t(6)A37 methyltransferase TsaA
MAHASVSSTAILLKSVSLACFAITAIFAAGMALASRHSLRQAQARIKALQADLNHEERKYKQERIGRIRMQKKLEGEVGFNVHHGGMQSIGKLDSVFRKRFGTPRQGLVVPYARARLKIDAQHYPKDSLDGLQEYSHVWLIYLFHANTNTARRTKDHTSAVRAKVRPPRLGGKTVGLFSTRTPHRPNPIGLSLVKLDRIVGDTLHLSSVDLVHGTPVLDIKPYLPYADSIAGATVPHWVVESPVPSLGSVSITEAAMNQIRCGKFDFFSGGEEYALALQQVFCDSGSFVPVHVLFNIASVVVKRW